MYGVAFVVLFALNIALAIYVGTNAKSHAQPWRLFAIGTLAVFTGYGLEQLAPALNSLGLTAAEPSLTHLLKLTNLILGAMAGALISVAISNRAKFMHERELKALVDLRYKHDAESKKFLEELRATLDEKSSDPGNIALSRSRAQALGRLADKALDAKQALDAQISKLSP